MIWTVKILNGFIKTLTGYEPSCRFEPSCSHYFCGCIEKFGVLKGSILGMKRILRCRPTGGTGFDPIP